MPYTDLSKEAKTNEEQGRYSTASDLYFRSAAERASKNPNESAVDPSTINLALADLLRAIYCARRTNADCRARNLGKVFEGFTAIILDYSEYEAFDGLATELRGDLQLLLEEPESVELYEQAAVLYNDLSEVEQLTWGMEPEFVHAHWVVEDFVAWIGVELPEQTGSGEPITTDFQGRIEIKKQIAEEVCNL